MTERPVNPTGSDQKPPEQPRSFRVAIRTDKVSSFSGLPRRVRTAIAGFDDRVVSQLAEEDLLGPKGDMALVLGGPLSDLKNFGDPTIPNRGVTQAIVTSILDGKILAGISIVWLDANGQPLDVFIGRALDDDYREVVAPLALAIRHKVLEQEGIQSYTTRIWERSEYLYNRLGVTYKEVEDPHPSGGIKKVEVTVNTPHTNQLFSKLGLDPKSDPFQTTYRMTLRPLPRPLSPNS